MFKKIRKSVILPTIKNITRHWYQSHCIIWSKSNQRLRSYARHRQTNKHANTNAQTHRHNENSGRSSSALKPHFDAIICAVPDNCIYSLSSSSRIFRCSTSWANSQISFRIHTGKLFLARTSFIVFKPPLWETGVMTNYIDSDKKCVFEQ